MAHPEPGQPARLAPGAVEQHHVLAVLRGQGEPVGRPPDAAGGPAAGQRVHHLLAGGQVDQVHAVLGGPREHRAVRGQLGGVGGERLDPPLRTGPQVEHLHLAAQPWPVHSRTRRVPSGVRRGEAASAMSGAAGTCTSGPPPAGATWTDTVPDR